MLVRLPEDAADRLAHCQELTSQSVLVHVGSSRLWLRAGAGVFATATVCDCSHVSISRRAAYKLGVMLCMLCHGKADLACAGWRLAAFFEIPPVAEASILACPCAGFIPHQQPFRRKSTPTQ